MLKKRVNELEESLHKVEVALFEREGKSVSVGCVKCLCMSVAN